MIATDKLPSTWQTLRDTEAHLFLRIGASAVLGFLYAGLACLGGGVADLFLRSLISPRSAMSLMLLGACFAWLFSLWQIWRVIRGARPISHAAVFTIIISLLVISGLFALDEYARRGKEEIMLGWFFCGLASIMFVWLSAFHRLFHRFPVLDHDNQVRVHCPTCGYSLIGLTELRCPECGTTFTIDELIRAQRYAGAENTVRTSKPAPDLARPGCAEPEPVTN